MIRKWHRTSANKMCNVSNYVKFPRRPQRNNPPLLPRPFAPGLLCCFVFSAIVGTLSWTICLCTRCSKRSLIPTSKPFLCPLCPFGGGYVSLVNCLTTFAAETLFVELQVYKHRSPSGRNKKDSTSVRLKAESLVWDEPRCAAARSTQSADKWSIMWQTSRW